jgi:hypothetical protein
VTLSNIQATPAANFWPQHCCESDRLESRNRVANRTNRLIIHPRVALRHDVRSLFLGALRTSAAQRSTSVNDPKRTTMLKLDGIRRSLSIRRAGHSSVGAPK